MSILIITHSDDNDSVSLVAEAIASKGGHLIRFNTDRYPTEVRLSAYYGKAGDERLTLTNEEGEFDLREVTAIWHRRLNLGAGIPATLAPPALRFHWRDECRRSRMLASLNAFRGDQRVTSVTPKKAVTVTMARELKLDTPRTVTTNDPDAVLDFAVKSCECGW